MKAHYFFIYLLIEITFCICLQPNEDEATNHIEFSNKKITIIKGKASINDTILIIEKAGSYLVTGESEEGNIVIKSNSVVLFLQNLNLSSKKNAPIIITSNLKNITIYNKNDTTLNDLENKKTTTGECAVIKIKKNSVVKFINEETLKLNGKCKDGIKGGSKTTLIFNESEEGEYIINSKKAAIDADGLIEFKGGKFIIESENGDAIKSSPTDFDKESLGIILVNDGAFNIHCFNDAFTAKNNIVIKKGNFEIKTEEGYDSETYNETESSKGFKVTNNGTGCGIYIYSGEFHLNTADDAFRSNRDITILSGEFEIRTKDDGICAKYDLLLGKKDSDDDDLKINIENSYEGLEGMTVTIFSGKIICKSKDDGINASGIIRKQRRPPGGGQGGFRPNRNNSESNRNNSERFRPPFNDSSMDWNSIRRNHTGAPPNDSYIMRFFGGEIYAYTDSDGIDCNGHLYIHGGNINVFSVGSGANEPIDHNGNFTLFNAEVLGVGTGGLEFVHEGIKKGNQMYAFYDGKITKNKKLEITDEDDEVIKEGKITKDCNYIFYTSSKLNENFHFYLIDEDDNREELTFEFGHPEDGPDDLDKYGINNQNVEDNEVNEDNNDDEDDENDQNNDEKKGDKVNENGEKKSYSKYLKIIMLGINLLLL